MTPSVLLPPYVPLGAPHIDLAKPHLVSTGLMRRVLAYDRDLVIFYDRGLARYGIGRKGRDGRVRLIAMWQGEAGQFLPLDDRLMDALAHWDLRPDRLDAPRSADEDAAARDEADLARAQKVEDRFDDDISHLTRSNRRHLVKVLERNL